MSCMKAKHISLAVFLLCAFGTLFFRLYQFMRPGEVASDFFSSEFFCFFFNVVGFVVMGLCSKFFPNIRNVNCDCSEEICDKRPFKGVLVCRSGFVAIISVLLGVFVSANGVMILQKYISGVRNFYPLAEGIFASAAGVIFVLTGVCYGIGKNLFVNNELLAVLPVAWGAARSIGIFLRYHVVSNVAWELSDVLATVFLSLFLLNHAKCLANREDSKKENHLRLYGYSAAMFVLIYISRTLLDCKFDLSNLANIVGDSNLIYVTFSFLAVDALIFFYILSVVISNDSSACENVGTCCESC